MHRVTAVTDVDSIPDYSQLDLNGLNAGANEIDRRTRELPFLAIDQDIATQQETSGQSFMLVRPPAQQARSLEIFMLQKGQIDPLFDE